MPQPMSSYQRNIIESLKPGAELEHKTIMMGSTRQPIPPKIDGNPISKTTLNSLAKQGYLTSKKSGHMTITYTRTEKALEE